jgi:hypothetical protein
MSHPNASSAGSPSGKTRHSDRRGSVRYASGHSCGCHAVGEGNEENWPATIRDLSADGVSLVVCHAFTAGEFLSVELDDPIEGVRNRLFVRVKHASPQGDGLWVLGCRLVNRLNAIELKQLR